MFFRLLGDFCYNMTKKTIRRKHKSKNDIRIYISMCSVLSFSKQSILKKGVCASKYMSSSKKAMFFWGGSMLTLPHPPELRVNEPPTGSTNKPQKVEVQPTWMSTIQLEGKNFFCVSMKRFNMSHKNET